MESEKKRRSRVDAGLLLFILCLGAFFVSIPLTRAMAITGLEIMEQVDARDDGDCMVADMSMLLIDRHGNERLRSLKVFSRDQGQDTWRVQFFLAPADVKDAAFLTYDYHSGAKDDDQWLFLPALHKTKRIASADKSASYMGSDLSYADMTRRVVDEWRYTLLKESKVDGHPVWLVEAIPRDEEVAERYGYEKSVLFIRQDIFFIVRSVNWIRGSGELKYMEVSRLEQIDGIWVGTEIRVKTAAGRVTRHRTVLTFDNVRFNQPLDKDLFSVRRLEKGL